MSLFARQLRRLREQAGMSRQQLADKADVSVRSLEKWEQGIREPTWALIVALARALGASTDSFAEDDGIADDEPTTDATPRPRGRPPKAEATPEPTKRKKKKE